MVSTHLKNIGQIGSFPQVGVKFIQTKGTHAFPVYLQPPPHWRATHAARLPLSPPEPYDGSNLQQPAACPRRESTHWYDLSGSDCWADESRPRVHPNLWQLASLAYLHCGDVSGYQPTWTRSRFCHGQAASQACEQNDQAGQKPATATAHPEPEPPNYPRRLDQPLDWTGFAAICGEVHQGSASPNKTMHSLPEIPCWNPSLENRTASPRSDAWCLKVLLTKLWQYHGWFQGDGLPASLVGEARCWTPLPGQLRIHWPVKQSDEPPPTLEESNAKRD